MMLIIIQLLTFVEVNIRNYRSNIYDNLLRQKPKNGHIRKVVA